MIFRFSFFYLVFILVFCSGCPQTEKKNIPASSDKKEKVFGVLAAVEPIAWLADRIGGGRFHTEVLVNSGKEPETFTPSPQKIVSLTQNKIFFRVGLISEQTLLPKLKTNAPEMKIIDLREGLVLLPLHDHSALASDLSQKSHEHEHKLNKKHSLYHKEIIQNDQDHDHDHLQKHETTGKQKSNHDSHNDLAHHDHEAEHSENNHHSDSGNANHDCGEDGLDPHFWMSPELTKKIIQTMVIALEKEDPAGGPTYQKNAETLIKEINELQTKIQKKLKPLQGKSILVFHPAYGYYCQEFGLIQLAVEEGGKAPRPKMISSLIAKIQKNNIQLLIVQPEFNRESADSMANAAQLKTALHSPLIADYFRNLNELTDLIVSSTPMPAMIPSDAGKH